MKTTKVPEIKPDLVAEVYFNPNVCVANPRKKRKPKSIPPQNVFLLMPFRILGTKGEKIKKAMRKRVPRNNIGDESFKADLIITNVAPQIMVLRSNALSPKYFFI